MIISVINIYLVVESRTRFASGRVEGHTAERSGEGLGYLTKRYGSMRGDVNDCCPRTKGGAEHMRVFENYDDALQWLNLQTLK